MKLRFPFIFQIVLRLPQFLAIFAFLFSAKNLWAAQDAIVTSDLAVVYSDEQMSSSVGYIKKGKKIRVGDVARNKAQVYPVVISGKIAYIRVLDVSTEKEGVAATNLIAERFQNITQKRKITTNYSASYQTYSSQVTLQNKNDKLSDKDAVNWQGVGIRGGAEIIGRLELDLMLNYFGSAVANESFRMVEFGFGLSTRLIDFNRFKVRLFGQMLAVPFANYELKDQFRLNSYGYSLGSGVSAAYRFGRSWGLEAFGGLYYSKLMAFDVPVPYDQIAPSFVGSRMGAGLIYEF